MALPGHTEYQDGILIFDLSNWEILEDRKLRRGLNQLCINQRNGKIYCANSHYKEIEVLNEDGYSDFVSVPIRSAIHMESKDELPFSDNLIREIKTDVSAIKQDISSTAVFKGMTQTEVANVREQIRDIQQAQLRMEEKQDKIFEILTTINNKK